jgi:hypothetical protein
VLKIERGTRLSQLFKDGSVRAIVGRGIAEYPTGKAGHGMATEPGSAAGFLMEELSDPSAAVASAGKPGAVFRLLAAHSLQATLEPASRCHVFNANEGHERGFIAVVDAKWDWWTTFHIVRKLANSGNYLVIIWFEVQINR